MIGNNIKKVRKNRHVSQRDFAKILKIPVSTLANYENNHREPNAEMLNKISQSLNVPIKTLLAAESFDSEILTRAINLIIPTLPEDADDVFAYLEIYTHDYDSLISFYNKITNKLPMNCIKGLLNFIFEISRDEFKEMYTSLILTEIYNLDNELEHYCKGLYDRIELEDSYKKIGATIDNNKIILPPIKFEEMISKVDELFPALQAEITFLSNSNVQMVFNYSYNEFSKKGYDELLISAIEKAMHETIKDIKAHLSNGDLFDGVSSWISKDSPLYETLKKHIKNDKSINKEITHDNFKTVAAHNDNLTDDEIKEADKRILEDLNKRNNKE